MKVAVEFPSMDDVRKFTKVVENVRDDVRLTGKDEHGNDWSLSAKSLLCSLVMATKFQKDREHTAHEVDWNTLYCECDTDIYMLIKDFVVIEPR